MIYMSLPHVEWGKRVNRASILITRVGWKLESAIRSGMLTRDQAIADIEAGVVKGCYRGASSDGYKKKPFAPKTPCRYTNTNR